MIVVNTRILDKPITGAQRYLHELLRRFGKEIRQLKAPRSAQGPVGHLWEQFVLPLRVGTNLLWSPSITGPLAVSNQVVTIFDTNSFDNPDTLNAKFGMWYRWIIPKLARKVSSIIAISNFTKQKIIEHTGVREEKIVVIPCGFDQRFGRKGEQEIGEVMRKLRLPSRSYVLSLGTIEPRKNIRRMLLAWSRIVDRLPEDLWLVLAGGEGRRLVFQGAEIGETPKRVFMTGHVEDSLLPALYSGALFFAYPSYYEGFGLPPLEAMATGTPVITGNRASLPEVIGTAGLMVDPFNVDEIANGMYELATNGQMRDVLSIKGVNRAAGFSWDACAERTLALLKAFDEI